jgi:DNA polymerase/3'-5' exonuclease PolX
MHLEEARAIGDEVAGLLRPACHRVVVAGSVRRLKRDPHDVEIVAQPLLEKRNVDMFRYEVVPVTDAVFADLQERRLLLLDQRVKRNGPRYKRFLYRDTEIPVEVFLVHDVGQWGPLLAIRTGPAEFGHKLVTARVQGGAMPDGMRMAGGWPERDEMRVYAENERAFFDAIGVPLWSPEDRTLSRLVSFLARREMACE